MPNDRILLDLLDRIHRGDDFHSIMSRLGDPEFDRAVEDAVRYGYVTGMTALRVANGDLVVDATHVSLTESGVAYLRGKSL